MPRTYKPPVNKSSQSPHQTKSPATTPDKALARQPSTLATSSIRHSPHRQSTRTSSRLSQLKPQKKNKISDTAHNNDSYQYQLSDDGPKSNTRRFSKQSTDKLSSTPVRSKRKPLSNITNTNKKQIKINNKSDQQSMITTDELDNETISTSLRQTRQSVRPIKLNTVKHIPNTINRHINNIVSKPSKTIQNNKSKSTRHNIKPIVFGSIDDIISGTDNHTSTRDHHDDGASNDNKIVIDPRLKVSIYQPFTTSNEEWLNAMNK